MFRSRKPRGQRSVRKIETEEDGEDMEVEEAGKPEIQAPKVKKEKKSKKEKKNKPKAALSFGDDDTEESGEFKVKKSNRSRKLAEKLRNEVEKESKENRGSYWGSANKYSAADLSQLKQTQKLIPMDTQPIIMNSDELDKANADAGVKSAFREKILDRMGAGSDIPDANAIHEARKKREEARRNKQTEQSYIPISKSKASKKGGRLAQQDSDGEENVIKMEGVRTNGYLQDDIDVGRERDDESVQKWESELIRGSNVPGHIPNAPVEHLTRRINTIENVLTRMENKLDDVRERLAENQQNLKNIEADESRSEQPLPDEANDIELQERYSYFSEMNAWLKDFTNFVNAKRDEVEKWHGEVRSTQAEKASVLLRRRQLDVKDCGQQFPFHGTKHGVPIENLAPDVQDRIRARDGRRRRRAEIRSHSRVSKTHVPGDSTDDELDPENAAVFEEKFRKLEEERLQIYADVVEEYTDSHLLMNRFNKWRVSFPRWYKVCFIEECTGSVIMPILKVEMKGWTPDSCALEETKTIENAIRYSIAPEEPEVMLIPFVLAKYPLETVNWWIKEIYDPISTKQTKALADLLSSPLMKNLPWAHQEDSKMQKLNANVLARIRRCRDEDIFIPILNTETKPDFSVGEGLYFQRQWNRTIKLIRNILEFDGFFAPHTLQSLVIDGLINKDLLMRLRSLPKDGNTLIRCAGIVELLPSSWFMNLTDVTLKPLRPLATFIAKLSSDKELYSKGKELLKRMKASEQLQQAKYQLPIE